MGARKLFKAWSGSGPAGRPGSWHFRGTARTRGRPVYFSTTFQPPKMSTARHSIHSQKYRIYPRIQKLIEILYAELVV
jgi:hypothetical protein